MGGSSSSSSSTTNNYTTSNTSGTAAASGDNLGNMISGVTDSNITVTDGGAVNKALEMMFKNSDSAFDFGNKALQVNEAVTKAAMNHSGTSLDKALDFGRDALEAAQGATDSALDVAKNLSLDSDAATARDTNKNMMYTTIAIAVALGIVAMKGK